MYRVKTNNSVEGNNVITLKHGDSMLDITASMPKRIVTDSRFGYDSISDFLQNKADFMSDFLQKSVLELLKYNTPTQRHELYYWQNLSRGAQAEVDYVIVKDAQVVPIEVKAGVSGSMKSMYQFISDKHLQYGIRTSLENFGALEKVQIIPLYALSTIFKCNSQMPLHDGL